MKMDMKIFFDHVRHSAFGGKLSNSQVMGIERLINAWELYGFGLDTGCCYVLAVSRHETGGRMQPVRETFASSDKQAKARLTSAWKAGKMKWVKRDYWSDGWFGRGDVQLTHEDNYSGPMRDAVLGKFGVDIHADPNAVLDPEISAFILVEGITKGMTTKSDFTAYALEDFVNEAKTDYDNARKTVNPKEYDSYTVVGDYARAFEAAMRAAKEAVGEPFLGADVSIYNGSPNREVEAVQRRLKELGYADVGTVDGRWGSKTRAAVLAFRADNSLPLKVSITDDEFLATLLRADKRVISTERATTTAKDLQNRGSETIATADIVEKGGLVAVGTGVLSGVNEVLKDVKGTSDTVSSIVGVLNPIIEFAKDNAMVIIFAVGAFIVYNALRIKKIRVEEHRSGENTSL